MSYNAPGQHHHNVYVRVKGPVPLRYADGRWTGEVVTPEQLRYDGSKVGEEKYNGRLRLDLHELTARAPIEGQDRRGRMAFHLGGRGYCDPMPAYGHVWLGDLVSLDGHQPHSAGGGRGTAAAGKPGAVLRVDPHGIPGDMHYKRQGTPGQNWGNYTRGYGALLWSFLQDSNGITVGGGGHLRAILRPGSSVRETIVPRIHAYSWDETGRHNGFVWGAYCRAHSGSSELHGWLIAAHQLESGPIVKHLAANPQVSS